MAFFRTDVAPLNWDYRYDNQKDLNAPVVIPESVQTIRCTFKNCTNFNQPINIPDNVSNCYETFQNCTNFDQPINIPSNVLSMNHMFNGCKNFNKAVKFKDISRCLDMSWTFGYTNYNQSMTLPSTCVTADHMFAYCYNLDKNIYVYDNVYTCNGMFQYCYNYNKPHKFSNNLRYASSMFSRTNINQIMYLPENLDNASWMFNCCYNLNSLVYLSNNIRNLCRMFFGCNNFNPISNDERNNALTMPIAAKDCSYMFYNCNHWFLDNEYYFLINYFFDYKHNNYTNVAYMFKGCSNFRIYGSTINSILYTLQNSSNVTSFTGMFDGINMLTEAQYLTIEGINADNPINCAYLLANIRYYSGYNYAINLGRNVINAAGLFYNSNISLFINNLDNAPNRMFQNLIDCSYMFYNAPNTLTITGPFFQKISLPNVINAAYMFAKTNVCQGTSRSYFISDSRLNLRNWPNVKNISHLFDGCYDGNLLEFYITPSNNIIDDASYMFANFYGLNNRAKYNFQNAFKLNIEKDFLVRNYRGMFENALVNLYYCNISRYATDCSRMFYNAGLSLLYGLHSIRFYNSDPCNVHNMLYNKPNTYGLVIYANNAKGITSQNILGKYLTWSTNLSNNCTYNDAERIYIYNNINID